LNNLFDEGAIMPASAEGPTFVPLGLEPSFGFGDRIGLATPGHVAAMRQSGQGLLPIYPQQSIREMTRTGRTPEQVLDDARRGMQIAGWTGTSGADADHLKTTADIDATFRAGYCFFTLDPSDRVDQHADDDDQATLRAKLARMGDEVRWVEEYRGKRVELANGTRLEFTDEACRRAAVKYGRAVALAIELADHLARIHRDAGREYEVELSVDETPNPTTLVEHFIVADQCLRHGMPLVSLAPRLPGDLEKAVDFRGDAGRLRQALEDHAAIAEQLGPYKLSLHSGSDKISVYAPLARATRGRFHVKTAGTSYLEALRVAARHDESLLRRIIDFSRDRFAVDRATYHLSAELSAVPPSGALPSPAELEATYLQCWSAVPQGAGFSNPGRQILHCTFGSVLTDPQLGRALRQLLAAHPDTYTELLQAHFVRHLEALQAGL
jgi:hypothetical protein